MADDYERLIVLLEGRVDAFEKAMISAEKRGTATYQKLQSGAMKATTDMQARINNMARSNASAMDMVAGKTEAAAERSAKSYQSWWREAERARDKINALRSSLDPAFAAQMRYDQAVEEVNDALRRNIITETEHRQVMDQVSAAYVQGGRAAGAHTGMLGSLGTMSDSTKAKLQNAGFQVQDVAVQMMAGTDAARALAMQLPQLLGGFGLLGVVLGTLTSIGLPLLASWFGEAEGAAGGLDNSLSALQNSVQAMNEAATAYTVEGLEAMRQKYGEIDQSILTLIEHQRQFAVDRAEADAAAAVRALADEYGALSINLDAVGQAAKGPTLQIMNMAKELGLTTDQTRELVRALQEADSATTFAGRAEALSRVASLLQLSADKASDLTKGVIDAEAAMRELAVSVPGAGWLAAAIGQAETLAGKLWEAVRANAALAGGPALTAMDDERGSQRGIVHDATGWVRDNPATGGGGGGGGGGGSGRMDSLIAELQTERETITAWYEESLTLLNGATEAELAAVGGKHEALERLELEHQERLKGIRDEAQTNTLADVGTFFGGMASLTKAGGDRMLTAHRAFSAAQGVINSYTAFTEVLKDPSFIGRPWARFGAAAAALSAGLGAVASIRSGGGGKPSGGTSSGGSGSGASSSGADAGSANPLRASIAPIDPSALFTGAAVRKLLDGLQEEAGNRGLILGWQP